MSAFDGGPAFPSRPQLIGTEDFRGMTLRDWFAGQALAGFCVSASETDFWLAGEMAKSTPQNFAREAYRVADKMLAERAEET